MYYPHDDFDRNSYHAPVESTFRTLESPAPEAAQAPAGKPKKKHTALKIVALCLSCLLLGGAAGLGGAALYASQFQNQSSQSGRSDPDGGSTTIYQGEERTVPAVNVATVSTGQVLSPDQVYAANVDSCVGITITTTTNFYGYVTSSAVSGSGFVLTSDGYIITNYHVVEEAAKDRSLPITVFFNDGSSYQAEYVGGEKDNDVAVLKVDAKGLKPVVLGSSDDLAVGNPVYAIGNPLGELTFSFTSGVVSALDRVITTGSGADATSLNMLQTDCAINSGNSGGPLFNAYGEVIGITTAKMSGSSSSSATIEGLGFAIPINDVKDMIQDLMRYGYVTGKPYMGITVSSVSEIDAQRYNQPVGAYVESVEEGSCAEKAGLKRGDIITAMDDTEITTHSALSAAKATYRAGDTVTLTVYRNGKKLELSLTFDEAAPAENSSSDSQDQQTVLPSTGDGYGNGFDFGNGYNWFFPFG